MTKDSNSGGSNTGRRSDERSEGQTNRHGNSGTTRRRSRRPKRRGSSPVGNQVGTQNPENRHDEGSRPSSAQQSETVTPQRSGRKIGSIGSKPLHRGQQKKRPREENTSGEGRTRYPQQKKTARENPSTSQGRIRQEQRNKTSEDVKTDAGGQSRGERTSRLQRIDDPAGSAEASKRSRTRRRRRRTNPRKEMPGAARATVESLPQKQRVSDGRPLRSEESRQERTTETSVRAVSERQPRRRDGHRRSRDRIDRQTQERTRDTASEREPSPRAVTPVYLIEQNENPWQLTEDEPDYDWTEGQRLFNVVVVRISSGGLREEFDAGDSLYNRGDQVIVETDKGLQLGEVVADSRRVMRAFSQLPRVIRLMTPNDTRQERRNQEKEEQAFRLCQQLIGEHQLQMKLICVDYLHGGNRAIFYFSAEGRIDFRQLVRDLASRLHTRIEMRQVGVRDASRYIGGIGPCGQQLCCSSFLQRFAPVSIRMAKDQNLVLNPQKVSGVCGRLMCCLTYEQKGYEHLRKGLPKTGKKVQLKDGRIAKVRDIDVLQRLLRLQFEDGSFEVVMSDEVVLSTPDEEPGGRTRPSKSQENTD